MKMFQLTGSKSHSVLLKIFKSEFCASLPTIVHVTNENESSDDSMSSLSNLISHQQGDVRYHLNSEQRETTTTSSNITDQSGCEQRLSQSTRNSPVKKVKMKLKRNHSSPVLETTKCLKLRSNNETNNDSVITV